MPRRNPCGKVTYRSRRAILKALEHMGTGENRNEIRAYYCRKCPGWHMTSKI